MMLRALMEGLTITPVSVPAGDVRVCDITEDSRTVLPGSLFVARRGEKSDGRAFIPQAIAAGAVAILTDDQQVRLPAGSERSVALVAAPDVQLAAALLGERFYGSPSGKLNLIGVTGTNGKTTITFLIHQMLNAAGVRAGLIGTVCVDDGVEVAASALTTPPALELSRTMARMVEAGCKACVMETSSHALDQQRVGGLSYRVGVFTNLSHDHLDYHQTMDAYAAAKARLFQMLPSAEKGGVAIINIDDPWAERMVAYCRAKVVRCSMAGRRSVGAGPMADCTGRVLGGTAASTRVAINGPFSGGKEWEITIPLIGPHNVMNALQAACAAHAAGISGEAIRNGLEGAGAPPGRMERVTSEESPVTVYVDYAHSDDSLRRVLQVCRDALHGTKGKLHVVFGCGGDRDKTKRPKMGAAAAETADRVIVTSDNPRSEDPRAIIDEIMVGIPAGARNKTTVEVDRRAAIAGAVAEAKTGDIVLLAGKGHEDYQILPDGRGGTHKTHFDDREEARAALIARGIEPTPAPGQLLAVTRAHPVVAAAHGSVKHAPHPPNQRTTA